MREHQKLNVKKKIIFFLLDKQKYNLVEINNRIYFAKKIGDDYAEIRYDKDDGWCWISNNLITFFSSLTGFQVSEVQELIGNWVEHTLQMEVKYSLFDSWGHPLLVEHTLQLTYLYV